jgi:hypothetical protein
MNQEFAWLNRNVAAVSVDVDCHFVSLSLSFGHGFLVGCGSSERRRCGKIRIA